MDLTDCGDTPVEVQIDRIDRVIDLQHPTKHIEPPTDLAGRIATLPGVTLLGPARPVKLGGLDAQQLDVRSGAKEVDLARTGLVDPPMFGFGPHQSHRIIAVVVDRVHVVFVIGAVNAGDDIPGHFEAATDILQPLVDSVSWG